MANTSAYLETALLNHVLRNVPMVSPSQIYLALYLTEPTDYDSGTEVTGGSYVRQLIVFDPPAPGTGQSTVSSRDRIEFPIATTPWGNILWYGIRNAPTGGNLLLSGPLMRARDIQTGDQVVFTSGEINVSLI